MCAMWSDLRMCFLNQVSRDTSITNFSLAMQWLRCWLLANNSELRIKSWCNFWGKLRISVFSGFSGWARYQFFHVGHHPVMLLRWIWWGGTGTAQHFPTRTWLWLDQPNEPGRRCFCRPGPHSRTFHIFLTWSHGHSSCHRYQHQQHKEDHSDKDHDAKERVSHC